MKLLKILLVVGFTSIVLAEDSCVLHHSTLGVINLASLGLRTGQPRFRDLAPTSGGSFTYSFNPCYSFTESECQNAAICQVTQDRQRSFVLAKQNASTWSLDSNNSPILTYTYGNKVVTIAMVCSDADEDSFDVYGEYLQDHYSMVLRSRCACWNGCSVPQSSTVSSRRPPETTHTYYASACKYSDSQYGTIDLSTIGNIVGSPKFKDISAMPPNSYVWSYNPCYKFSENTCHNVAGCQVDRVHGVGYAIGLQEYAYWVNMTATKHFDPWIIYPSPQNNRRLAVQLICDRSGSSHSLQVIGEISPGEYLMKLTSPCACWNGCVQPAPRPSPFTRRFWMIATITASAVFLLFCMLTTCLFCSKPRRLRRPVIINEKTPFFSSINNQKR